MTQRTLTPDQRMQRLYESRERDLLELGSRTVKAQRDEALAPWTSFRRRVWRMGKEA